MLYPTGFLTHCSYHKLKKKYVLFLQLYNHPYSGLISQIQTNLQFVIQLNCMSFSPYSAFYFCFIYSSNQLPQLAHIMISQHFYS